LHWALFGCIFVGLAETRAEAPRRSLMSAARNPGKVETTGGRKIELVRTGMVLPRLDLKTFLEHPALYFRLFPKAHGYVAHARPPLRSITKT
jgi:hypothetical protein